MVSNVRSPLVWIGGKFHSTQHILRAFPPSYAYDSYCEPFAGALHVLFAKPVGRHLEIVNDLNHDLINFWLHCKFHQHELQTFLEQLPYSRLLYEEWQASLWDGSQMSDLERAARFFYVLRSSIGGHMRPRQGDWGYVVKDSVKNNARALASALDLFEAVSDRLQHVQIESQDYAKIIRRYQTPHTLFYVDPPYIGTEGYYEGAPQFTMADHEHLAATLNATPSYVALSYYPHPLLRSLYPVSKWRRVTWPTYKHAEKLKDGKSRKPATELLLLNYPEPAKSLWDSQFMISCSNHELAEEEIV